MPSAQQPPRSLWANRDFLALWLGETVSAFGSQITGLALPLTAVLALDATPADMGRLGAAQFAPFLLLTLLAGVWVDRVPKRPVLVAANLGRAALLALVPLAALSGRLTMPLLYAVTFAAGVLQVAFDLAYQSFVPALVDRRQLVEANGRLQLSNSLSQVAGPGLAGVLVELLTAPVAIALDALSFLVAGLGALTIRVRGEAAGRPAGPGGPRLWAQVREGMGDVLRDPYLRAMLLEAATFNVWQTAVSTLVVLYASRELGLRPAALGTILGAGSAGAVLGALAAHRLARVWGLGRALLGAYGLACAAPAFIPLAGGTAPVAAALLGLWSVCANLGVTVSNVYVVSLRQARIPAERFGRVNAAYRFFITGAVPAGALLAGWLGERIGLRATLAVAAAGTLSALPWVVFSPLPALRDLPADQGTATAAG